MNKNKDEILEEREITGNKKKLLLWGSLALREVLYRDKFKFRGGIRRTRGIC